MKTYLRQVCATIFLVCFSVVNLQVADAQPIPYRCATQEIDLLPKSKTLRPTNIFLNQSGTVDTTTIYTIPVVFVVYHLGESVGTGSNISDANLQAQLDHLNRNFSGQRTDYYGLDAKIRFAFARRSPSCNSSSGIVRVDARSVPGYQQQGVSPDDRTKDLQLQSLVPDYIGTGNDRFITVRIIHMANGGWAAYGGIYISAYFMTTDNSLLTHEVGHICGLAHTFAGSEAYNNYSCPFNENPKFDGDGVADTDPHKRAEPNNSCSSASEQQINSCTGRQFGLIGRNYMSYGCEPKIFTKGQILRMRTNLGQSQELVNSAYLTPPLAVDAVRTACRPTSVSAVTPHSEGVWSVNLEQLSNTTYPNNYNNGLNYYDYSCTKKVALTTGQTYVLTIWGWGRHRRVYLDWNDDGLFNEGTERLFNEDRLSNNGPETSKATITLPTTAVVDRFLRLRVIVDGGVTLPTACNLPGSANGSGEAEDYGVLVLPTQSCTVIRTVKAGNWKDPSIWSCSRLPTLNDTVEIAHTIDLHVDEVGQAGRLQYVSGGKLRMSVRAQLRLR